MLSATDDLAILDVGVQEVPGDPRGILDHYWLHVRLRDGGGERRVFKVVKMAILRYLPRETREQVTVLEKMRKVLKGLHNARVDFLCLVAGLFSPPPVGILQIYGVQAEHRDRDAALEIARQGMVALQAGMANFEQSRLEPLPLSLLERLRRAFAALAHAVVVIGHPDPRTEAARGMDGGGRPFAVQYGLQQNEMLFRGMAKAKQDFLNVVLCSRIDDMNDIYRLQERVAQEASRWASMEKFHRSISLGLGLPVILTGLLGDTTGQGYGEGQSYGQSDATTHTDAVAHTDGVTEGESWGEAHTEGESWGEAHTTGESWGTAHTVGAAHTTGVADGTSRVTSESWGTADTTSWSHTTGHASGTSTTTGTVTTTGVSHVESTNIGGSAELSLNPAGIGGNVGVSGGHTWADGQTSSVGVSQSTTSIETNFSSDTVGGAHTDSHSWGVARGVSHVDHSSDTASVSDTTSHSTMVADTTSHGTSVADTTSHATSVARSRADTVSQAESRSHADSRAVQVVRGHVLATAHGLGVGAGLAPTVSLSKTYQGEDHVATLVASALREQEYLLGVIAREGGMYVDNYFLVGSQEGKKALETLIPQAFHGVEEVVTPVRTRRLTPEEEEYIRLHAQTFTPSTRPEGNPWALEPWKDTTLLTLLQAATYVAPGVFEEGEALTVQERIPPFAFFPDMPGEVVLGHQISYETGEVTAVPLRLARERMSNWAFCADTRFGKSVAAERLILETAREWHFRNIVLDFGAGWRKLLNALPGHVDIWSLYPAGPRPIRWNPLQIGWRIPPERQMMATCEIIVNAGRMGERQHGFLRRTLRQLYVQQGVLTEDPEVLAGPLGVVSPQEAQILGVAPNTPLADLSPAERQRLAVERSKGVDMTMWYSALQAIYNRLPVRDVTNRTALDGILLRLEPFTTGRLAAMYGRGEGAIPIADLALPWGIAVLEGGEMDEYSKAVLLGLLAWHLYTDAVVRRRQGLGGAPQPPMTILFEEGNKVIGGVSLATESERPMSTEIFQNMFRDAGKYNIFLGIIAQSPAELPPGILSSCNNLMIGQLKNPRDRDVVLPAIGRSEKGYYYVDYANFIGRIPVGTMICKLGLASDVAQIEPLLIHPTRVDVPEPTDEEIYRTFAR